MLCDAHNSRLWGNLPDIIGIETFTSFGSVTVTKSLASSDFDKTF